MSESVTRLGRFGVHGVDVETTWTASEWIACQGIGVEFAWESCIFRASRDEERRRKMEHIYTTNMKRTKRHNNRWRLLVGG
jgi:hypothetical protein